MTLPQLFFSLLAGLRKIIYFLAPFLRCSSSRSRWACSLARCCARFSAAVIRGMMSSKGLSMILIDFILGGLLCTSVQLSDWKERKKYINDSLDWSPISINLYIHPGSVRQGRGQHRDETGVPISPIFITSLGVEKHMLSGEMTVCTFLKHQKDTHYTPYHQYIDRTQYVCHATLLLDLCSKQLVPGIIP